MRLCFQGLHSPCGESRKNLDSFSFPSSKPGKARDRGKRRDKREQELSEVLKPHSPARAAAPRRPRSMAGCMVPLASCVLEELGGCGLRRAAVARWAQAGLL